MENLGYESEEEWKERRKKNEGRGRKI